jgi:hypothetical protein
MIFVKDLASGPGRVWWLMSVISATQEVEIGRFAVDCQPRQKVSETPI